MLVSGPVAQEKQGTWMISVIGASLKKLRDDAHEASLSPDGSQIVFRNSVTKELWMMGSDGSQARLYLKPEPETLCLYPTWLPRGKRIAYNVVKETNGKLEQRIETRDLKGGDPVVLLSNPRINAGSWAGGGRLIYSVSETGQNQYDSNLWDLRFDEDTGKPKGSPRQLTDWTGFSFDYPVTSGDATRLVFQNTRRQSDVYVAELVSGGDELKTPQRLTLDDRLDWPGGWSPDSKTVLLYSDRAGSFDIYKQGINDRNAAPMVTGPEEKWTPQMSPDGKWILYLQWTRNAQEVNVDSGKLMRVPVAGGPPEFVMDVKGFPGVSSGGDVFRTAGGFPSFRCPMNAAADCVLAEKQDADNVVFTRFDAIKGKKSEVAKLSGGNLLSWDLSLDGARIASCIFSYNKGEVEITSLNGGPPVKFSPAPWFELLAIAWAGDGKSVFLASYSSRGTAILHSDLSGKAKLLFKPPWDIAALSPSPDGRTLAFGPIITNANAWTIAPFPH